MKRRTSSSRTCASGNSKREQSSSPDLTEHCISQFLSSIGTAKALAVWLLYSNDEHQQLVELDTNPLDYLSQDVDRFRADYAATEFLSKADFLKLPKEDRETKAIQKFLDAEAACRETNRRISPYLESGILPPNELHPKITKVQERVGKILRSFDLEEWFDNCGWGPGASTKMKSRDANGPHKFQYENGTTASMYPLLQPMLTAAYPAWAAEKNWQAIEVQVGNKVVTVPKNAKIDRVIAIEPGFNLWFQKGLGAVIRRRLRWSGLDLNSQEHNQKASELAVARNYVTVDFSSASDMISRASVKLLFAKADIKWLHALSLTRTQGGLLPDGSFLEWEKFSSMGNGFTFELESLIFFACAQACSRERVYVFGDDVIIPRESYEEFRTLTTILGFKVNPAKTHDSGVFRESCGSHWFSGVSVKPLYLKHRVRTIPQLYHFANSVRRLAHNWCYGFGCDSRFRRLFYSLVYSTPEKFRFGISEGYGDTGFVINRDEPFAVLEKRRFSYQSIRVRHLAEVPITWDLFGFGVLLHRLVTRSEKGEGNSIPLKGRTLAAINALDVWQWYSFGDWLEN